MRTDTTVRDVMHREFLGVSESDRLTDAARLLVDEETDCLVVLRGGEAVGRLTARDALDAVLDDGTPDAMTVGDVMRPPLPTVAPDDALTAVDELLVAEGVSQVVVTDDGEAVAVVTASDSVAAGATRAGDPVDPTSESTTAEERDEARLEVTPATAPDAARGSERARTAASTDASGASTHGVCEVCGALAPELADANGQAVCPNCRDV